MMLPMELTATALYVKSDIPYVLKNYEKRISFVCGYAYNIRRVSAEDIFAELMKTRARIENLTVLRNAIDAALSFLSPEQKAVVDAVYLRRMRREAVLAELKITPSVFRGRRRSALKKISAYLEILGFSEQRFLEYFNEEPRIIDEYRKVKTVYRCRENLLKRA